METFAGFSIGALLGYLSRVLLEHFLIKSRSSEERQISRFNDAAAVLREAFSAERAFLRSSAKLEAGEAYDMLKKAFPSHERAVFEFGEFLNGTEREAFLKAWEAYYYPEGMNILLPEEEVPAYLLAQYIGIHDEEEREKRAFALERLEAILEFAEPK